EPAFKIPEYTRKNVNLPTNGSAITLNANAENGSLSSAGIVPDSEEEVTRPADDKEPFSALAFKVMADPFVGKLTFFRVYSGILKAGSYVLNTAKGKRERIGRILQMHANSREE